MQPRMTRSGKAETKTELARGAEEKRSLEEATDNCPGREA